VSTNKVKFGVRHGLAGNSRERKAKAKAYSTSFPKQRPGTGFVALVFVCVPFKIVVYLPTFGTSNI
jgi:hypothetical protein